MNKHEQGLIVGELHAGSFPGSGCVSPLPQGWFRQHLKPIPIQCFGSAAESRIGSTASSNARPAAMPAVIRHCRRQAGYNKRKGGNSLMQAGMERASPARRDWPATAKYKATATAASMSTSTCPRDNSVPTDPMQTSSGSPRNAHQRARRIGSTGGGSAIIRPSSAQRRGAPRAAAGSRSPNTRSPQCKRTGRSAGAIRRIFSCPGHHNPTVYSGQLTRHPWRQFRQGRGSGCSRGLNRIASAGG